MAYSGSTVIEALKEQDSTEELHLSRVRMDPVSSWLRVPPALCKELAV